MKLSIYIDSQNTRSQYRVRLMKGRNEVIALYCMTQKEALRVKSYVRKIVNALGSQTHES